MGRNYNLFLGNKWNSLNIVENICFFGITSIICMELGNMGGYISYIIENHMINIGGIYDVQLHGCYL